MSKKTLVWLVGGVVVVLMVGLGGWRLSKIREQQKKVDKPGVVRARAISWEDNWVRVTWEWLEREPGSRLAVELKFADTTVMLPSNKDNTPIPLLSMKMPEWKTAFCRGDELEVKIRPEAQEKPLAELTTKDIAEIRNLGPRGCR